MVVRCKKTARETHKIFGGERDTYMNNWGKIFSKLSALILALTMIAALTPQMAMSVFAANTNVATEAALRSALTGAASGDTVTLTADISLTSTLTIATTGAGVTLLSDTASPGAPFTLTATGNYAAITVNSGATLTLGTSSTDGVNVTHSAGATSPGVVDNGTFNLVSGSIHHNSATSGVGVTINGSAIFNMSGGSVSNNTATGSATSGNGGGVWINTGGTFNMSGGAISNNTVPGAGGGVYNLGGSTFNMTGGTISGNTSNTPNTTIGATATGAGGGVYNGVTGSGVGSTFNMSGTALITDNHGDQGVGGGVAAVTASVVNMSGGTISNNTSKAGAGIIMQGGTLNMTGGTISGNSTLIPSGGSGAGICGPVVTQAGMASITISGGSITDNHAAGNGGAIAAILANGASVTMTAANGGVTIDGNTALASGGAGAFVVPVSITGATITNNTSNANGGGLLFSGSSSIVITDSTVSNNTALGTVGGGGIYANATSGNMTLTNCIIEHNSGAIGGGVFCAGNSLAIFGSTISNNEALGGADPIAAGTAVDGSGGGVCFNGGSTVVLKNDTFSDNTAATDGGGIWMNDLANLKIDTSLAPNKTVFSGNSASQAYIYTPGDDLVNDHYYNNNIFTTKWTSPFIFGYNNFDINFTVGVPVTGVWWNVMFQDTDPSVIPPVYTQIGSTAIVADGATVGTHNVPASNPSKLPNYLFVGWSDGVSPSLYDAMQIAGYIVTKDVTFTATYIPISNSKASVFFDYNFGTDGTGSTKYLTGNPGTDYAIPVVTRYGYDFAGWLGTPVIPNSGTGTFGAAASVATYTAQWTAKTYTVNYNTAGGTPATIAALTGVTWDQSNLLPATNPTKSGSIFVGWNVTAGGGATSVQSTAKYSDLAANDTTTSITLTAQWTPAPSAGNATVIFNYNGGTDGTSSFSSVNGPAGTGYVFPVSATLSKTGYTFNGWSPAEPAVPTYGAEGTVTSFSAQWTAKPCPVKFIDTDPANGGIDIVPDIETGTALFGTAIGDVVNTATVAVPADQSKAGYKFVGWSDGTNVYSGAAVAKYVINKESGVTFHAVYGQNAATDHTITYNGNNNTTGSAPQDLATYTTGAVITLPGDNGMTKTNAVFLGWTTVQNPATVTTQALEDALHISATYTMGASNAVLYAVWAQDSNNNGTPDYKETYSFTVQYCQDTYTALIGSLNGKSVFTVGHMLTAADVAADLGANWLNAKQPSGYYSGVVAAGFPVISSSAAANVVQVIYNKIPAGGGTVINYPPSGGGGGGGIITYVPPTPTPTPTPAPNLKEPDGTHSWYIRGYSDGSVKPNNNITRAEVAMVLWRLTQNADKNNAAGTQAFGDVDGSHWAYQQIQYLAGHGILHGYPDGSFAPDRNMTRAELAAVLTRFYDLPNGASSFNDISGNWSEEYINKAAAAGWVNGYPDGTFRPDNDETRAEFCTMVNHMLKRKIDAANIDPSLNVYSDLSGNFWAYADIIEASYTHGYAKFADDSEKWTSVDRSKSSQ